MSIFGGGGGSADRIAREQDARDKQREAEKRDALRRINVLFGVGDDTIGGTPGYTQLSDPRLAPFLGASAPGLRQAAERAGTYIPGTGGTSAAENRNTLERVYEGQSTAARDFYLPTHRRALDRAQRETRDYLARGGLSGGSVERDEANVLNQTATEDLGQLFAQSEGHEDSLRGAISQVYQNAIRDVASGLGTEAVDAAAIAKGQALQEKSYLTQPFQSILDTSGYLLANRLPQSIYDSEYQRARRGGGVSPGAGVGFQGDVRRGG